VSDIDTAVVDSLKALDPEWPIREADMADLLLASSRSKMTHLVISPSSIDALRKVYSITSSAMASK